MAETVVVEFGGRGGYLGLALLSRPFPDAEQAWGRDAILARVTIEAKEFRGEFEVITWSHELVHLRYVLQELDQKVGAPQERIFQFLDADLWLTFGLDRLGNITVGVDSRGGDPAGPARLLYTIGADQTYLQDWIGVIDDALIWYPLQMDWQPPVRKDDSPGRAGLPDGSVDSARGR